jgi:hypothetical protein
MKKANSLFAFLMVVAPLSLLGTGCANPNIYGTPRTTPKGKISHTVAAEGFGFRSKDANGQEVSGTVPTFPTYQLRYGVSDRIDLGFRVANMSSLGFDAKFNPVRSKAFDLALVPGGQWLHVGSSTSSSSGSSSASVDIVHLHLPVLLGLNVGDSVTLTASPGVLYSAIFGTATTTSSSSSDQRSSSQSTGGIFGRLGFGVNFRISDGFALHPEITAMHSFEHDVTLYMFGLGFNFGKLPQYGSSAGDPATTPAD